MRFVEVIVVYIILCFLEIVFCTGILSYRKIANEFMDESFENCDELFYGKWIGSCSEGEVFCRLKK